MPRETPEVRGLKDFALAELEMAFRAAVNDRPKRAAELAREAAGRLEQLAGGRAKGKGR